MHGLNQIFPSLRLADPGWRPLLFRGSPDVAGFFGRKELKGKSHLPIWVRGVWVRRAGLAFVLPSRKMLQMGMRGKTSDRGFQTLFPPGIGGRAGSA